MLNYAAYRTQHANRNRIAYIQERLTLFQQGRCLRCHSVAILQVDEVWPRALGGRVEWLNVQGLCQRCNILKSDRVETWWSEVVRALEWGAVLGPAGRQSGVVAVRGRPGRSEDEGRRFREGARRRPGQDRVRWLDRPGRLPAFAILR